MPAHSRSKVKILCAHCGELTEHGPFRHMGNHIGFFHRICPLVCQICYTSITNKRNDGSFDSALKYFQSFLRIKTNLLQAKATSDRYTVKIYQATSACMFERKIEEQGFQNLTQVLTDKPNPNIKVTFEKKVETPEKMKKISPYELLYRKRKAELHSDSSIPKRPKVEVSDTDEDVESKFTLQEQRVLSNLAKKSNGQHHLLFLAISALICED